MRYITETKNLFDINSVKKVSGNPSFSRNGNQITVSYGFPAMYQSANFLLDTSLVGKVVTITALAMTSGLNNTCIRIQWVANSGLAGGQEFQSNIITGNSFQKLTLRAVVPESPGENFNNLCIMFYSNYNASLEDGVTYSSTFKDVMIELGDTATPYVPYGYLPMRRMKYKVSNVCQLLDKSKYPATQTVKGVTFTNNGDGKWTISGKSTSGFAYYNLVHNLQLNQGHTYLAPYVDLGACYVEVKFKNKNGEVQWGVNRYTADENSKVDVGLIALDTFNGADTVLIPQIFDLTEMYGAGNEPTTVEEFRADFPDDLYEYTPYCWASMKNIRYIDTTKNLFDISKVTETDTLKVKGNSIYSYQYPVILSDTDTLSIFKSLKPNTNYTISAVCPYYLGNATTSIRLVSNNGSNFYLFDSYNSGFAQNTFSLTQEQIDNINFVYFYGRVESEGGPIIWSNIQIEEGDTATDYVPYGYLPLK